MNDLSGQSFGRYHLIEKLGEGGMAVVYKAFDTRLECDVAVKVIRVEDLPQSGVERALKRFEREAKAVAQLNHPNIVRVTDYGEQGGLPFLVMPYQSGGTLKGLLGKPIFYQEAVRLLAPVARALQYAHSRNIIHRDVKPSNILITESGEPMLTDFGIAKILDLQDGQTLTGTGVGIGTPEYMAPEQAIGHKVDARTDIYSLGVVFFELVTGRKPYTADTPMAVVIKQSMEPLPRPQNFVKELPEKVEAFIYKTMAKNADDRFQTMDEFLASFKKLVDSDFENIAPISKPVFLQSRENTSEKAENLEEDSDTIDEPNSPVDQHQSTAAASSFGNPLNHEESDVVNQNHEDAGAHDFHNENVSGLKKWSSPVIGILLIVFLIGIVSMVSKNVSEKHIEQTATARARSTVHAQSTQTMAAIELNAQKTATAEAVFSQMYNIQKTSYLLFGPEYGDLLHEPDDSYIECDVSGQELSDLITQATFVNPFGPEDSWNYGFIFRKISSTLQYRLIVSSTKEWELFLRDGDLKQTIASGYLEEFDTSVGAENTVTLFVYGEKGYLNVNDNFVEIVDLSVIKDPGDVEICTGFFSDDEKEGAETHYMDWEVYGLD